MIHAYDEILLGFACESLGRMLDFAEHSMHIKPNEMMALFISSGAASEFECGDIRIISGMSGVELTYEVLSRSGMEYERHLQRHTIALSGEYYCGYALARLQWELGVGFEDILSSLNISDLPGLYRERKNSLLESLPWNASETDKTNALESLASEYTDSVLQMFSAGMNESGRVSNLKKIRMKNGLSQSQLAGAAGVPLRTIQQYEQGQKDINKARAEYLIRLSSALRCEPSSLLQRD